jgi:site-specific recombinase XerD
VNNKTLQTHIDNFCSIAAERGFPQTPPAPTEMIWRSSRIFSKSGEDQWELNRETLLRYRTFLYERRYAETTIARKIAAVRSFLHFGGGRGCGFRSDPTP